MPVSMPVIRGRPQMSSRGTREQAERCGLFWMAADLITSPVMGHRLETIKFAIGARARMESQFYFGHPENA